MASWIVQLVTLLGVVLGALASFLSTRLTDRSRWQREERLRWDAKRLECYTDFSAAIIEFIGVVDRLAASLGLSAGAPPGPDDELPGLAAAEARVSMSWAQLLILGSPQVARAAQEWREETWVTESFARGLQADTVEFGNATQRRRQARARFYAAVRADLGVTTGDIPADLGTRQTLARAITPPDPERQTATGLGQPQSSGEYS